MNLLLRIGLSLLVLCISIAAAESSKGVRLTLSAAYHNDYHSNSLKRENNPHARFTRKTRGRAILARNNFLGVVTNITVGSPPRKFTVMVDTGSSLLWLPAKGCCSSNHWAPGVTCRDCFYNNTYDMLSSKSATVSERSVHIGYSRGFIDGVVVEDKVCLAKTCVDQQGFVDATTVVVDDRGKFDGIFGMGYPSLNRHQIKSYFQNLVEEQVTEPFFGIYLQKGFAVPEGILTLGVIDKDLFSGKITWVKLNSVGPHVFWKFPMDKIMVGDEVVACKGGCDAFVDSGASYIHGPREELVSIMQAIHADVAKQIYAYTVDCGKVSTTPTITFVIGGRKFKLTNDDYVIQVDENCIALFDYPTDLDIYALGNVFIQKFYTIFDAGENQIGFAYAKGEGKEDAPKDDEENEEDSKTPEDDVDEEEEATAKPKLPSFVGGSPSASDADDTFLDSVPETHAAQKPAKLVSTSSGDDYSDEILQEEDISVGETGKKGMGSSDSGPKPPGISPNSVAEADAKRSAMEGTSASQIAGVNSTDSMNSTAGVGSKKKSKKMKKHQEESEDEESSEIPGDDAEDEEPSPGIDLFHKLSKKPKESEKAGAAPEHDAEYADAPFGEDRQEASPSDTLIDARNKALARGAKAKLNARISGNEDEDDEEEDDYSSEKPSKKAGKGGIKGAKPEGGDDKEDEAPQKGSSQKGGAKGGKGAKAAQMQDIEAKEQGDEAKKH